MKKTKNPDKQETLNIALMRLRDQQRAREQRADKLAKQAERKKVCPVELVV